MRRRIVGWRVSSSLRSDLALDALEMAFERCVLATKSFTAKVRIDTPEELVRLEHQQQVIDEILFAVDSGRLAELEEVFLLCDEEGIRTRVAVTIVFEGERAIGFVVLNRRMRAERVLDQEPSALPSAALILSAISFPLRSVAGIASVL